MFNWIRKRKWWLFAIILLGGAATWFERWRTWRENSQDAVILAASAHHGVSPALVKAVVWRESWFNPNARGRAGEIGLMQIMPATADDWAKAERLSFFNHHQLYEPDKNTRCGAWYLKKLLARYTQTDNPLPYALADYNAGRARVLRWNHGVAATNSAAFLRQMDFPGAKKYVESVMQQYQHYRPIFPPRKK